MADQEELNKLLVRESGNGHTETVRVLLEAGADVQAVERLVAR